MEKLFLLVVALSTCAAHTDLTGKVFVFPNDWSDTDHVKVKTPETTFTAFTTCLRFISDKPGYYSLFSMATPTQSNAILIYRIWIDHFMLFSMNSYAFFWIPGEEAPTWNSLCFTWQSDNGLSQVWLNGKPSVKKYLTSGTVISGKPITILGQEQDTYGGGFDFYESFSGMISDVNMWDYVLSPTEIQVYMKRKHFTPGNVLNWRSLNYETTERISIEDDPEDLPW